MCYESKKTSNTYRHSGFWQDLTYSLVYMCTCSFLWCWDIQRFYIFQATGTRWCLWNRQSTSVISNISWLMEISWSHVYSQEKKNDFQSHPPPKLHISTLVHFLSNTLGSNDSHIERCQKIATDHVSKAARCGEAMKYGNIKVTQVHEIVMTGGRRTHLTGVKQYTLKILSCLGSKILQLWEHVQSCRHRAYHWEFQIVIILSIFPSQRPIWLRDPQLTSISESY